MSELPKWEQLPTLALYLDQVLLYVNQETRSAISPKEKALTAAMVNNYVKQGYLPKPDKKKYNRQQVARLIVLTICKPIFAITDIHAMMERLLAEEESSLLYNQFISCFQGETQEAHPLIQVACQTLHAYQATLHLVSELQTRKGEAHEPTL